MCIRDRSGIVLHTKDYAMYFGTEISGIEIEKGLTMGNLMSGTRARLGKYGTLEELEESRKTMALSTEGLRFEEELEALAPEEYARLVPSRYLEHPLSLIHICFFWNGDMRFRGQLPARHI